jgi:hypothetical protein
MERLIAWYRIGSSVGAVAALLVANAVPLVGVVLVVLKTALDLGLHLAEHREPAGALAPSAPRPGAAG